MQAALFLREKQELRKKKLKIRRGRYELPSHVATKDIAPFPQFPPNSWNYFMNRTAVLQGKAAWQDRELGYDVDRRESVCVPSEAATTHRFKQKEAHKRWVKRNRIHDSTFGDCSSEDEDTYGAYGVQSTAANALLYVGLGTMCIGMIIAFVGTGEKGFKTIELRLIGPSLIGIGVMIIILRVMLCVCPSKCLKCNKHKHKNSTNKLNSENEREERQWKESIECVREGKVSARPKKGENAAVPGRTSNIKKSDSKKRVSIAELPSTSATCGKGFLDAELAKVGSAERVPRLVPVQEKKDGKGCAPEGSHIPAGKDGKGDIESIGSDVSPPSHRANPKDPDEQSDDSLGSLANGFLHSDSSDSDRSTRTVKNASKFEARRSPRNAKSEILLNPSNLGELRESD